MSDIKSLIIKNDLNLPKEAVDRLLSMNGRSALHALSPDKESGPFLLYCCGDSLEVISAKTNIPADIIVATAIQYRWPDKARLLKRENPEVVPSYLQRDLVNSILVATVVAMQRELAEVIAGKRQPSDCALIPGSPAALEKLMDMVTTLNSASPGQQMQQPGTTVVHAQNVQINQNVKSETPEEGEEKKASRSVMIKEVEEA